METRSVWVNNTRKLVDRCLETQVAARLDIRNDPPPRYVVSHECFGNGIDQVEGSGSSSRLRHASAEQHGHIVGVKSVRV
jgi:hypothetical protein